MGGKPPTPINNIYILYDITADDKSNKLENFNYLNVAFISYKLTMWD